MANTIDADLLIDTLSAQVINVLPNKIAPFNAYSRDFSPAEWVETKSVQVMKVTGGSTTLSGDINDYESGDSATSNVAITPVKYSQPFHLSSRQVNQKLKIEQLAEANLNALATTLNGVVTALILAGTFTGTGATVAQASFSATNAKALRGQIGKVSSKNLLLDSVAFAQLAPTDKNGFQLAEKGAYGFDRIIEQTLWTGATANTYGVACGPEAIAIAAGIPEQAPGLSGVMIAQRVVEVPGIGLPVQVNLWASSKTRMLWCSYDIAFGAAVADASALVIIKSA